MSVLFEVCYKPVTIRAPDPRLEVGKTYGVIEIIDSPDCFWLQYRLQEVEGLFFSRDFYRKRLNLLAISHSDHLPKEGENIKLYGITIYDTTTESWYRSKSNLKIQKVVPYDKNFYDITTEYAVYHTYFKNL